MIQAVLARENAYAPYSQFKVGAAVLLDNGDVVLGSNQENAAFPSGLCAERTAVFFSRSKFSKSENKSFMYFRFLHNKRRIRPDFSFWSLQTIFVEVRK